MMPSALLVGVLVGTASARTPAPVDQGIGQPWTIGEDRIGVGLFRPLAWGAAEHTEVDVGTTALVGVLGFSAGVKQTLWENDNLGVAVVGNLSAPTAGLNALRGWVVPQDVKIPFTLVPKLGAIVGVRDLRGFKVSLGVDGRLGIPFGDFTWYTPDFYWLDPLVAPLTEGPTLGTQLQADWFPKNEGFGLSVRGRAQFGGIGPDYDGRLWSLWALDGHLAFGAGAAVAWEMRSYGRKFFWMPIGDIQLRW